MDTQAYPGEGLSPSQLIFALNEELKRLTRYSSFTLDEVSQLDRDALTALVTIREWKNSFVPINRIPLEVLSLIPTHLPSQEDRFRATFVCRRWRRTFLQHGPLWSEVYLRKGEVYVKTLLERAKGSALRVLASRTVPVEATALLAPHTEQIRSLDFDKSFWEDIQRFSEINSGPLPLLHTLNINAPCRISPSSISPSSLPLFSSAVNLQAFRLHLDGSRPLNLLVFPNLTSFELSADLWEEFWASDLLDFLEASPMLQVVHVKIIVGISYDGIPQERVVVLPDVESFSLVTSRDEPGYELAAHISCPSAKHMSLAYEPKKMITQEIFPALVCWNTITRQYTRSPVEEVVLEMEIPSYSTIECSLELRSPDATIISLHFVLPVQDDEDKEYNYDDRIEALEGMYWEAFSQACRTIRDLTLLTNIKRLRIDHTHCSFISHNTETARATNEVGQLFQSVGPLEELVLHRCDMDVYLASFHGNFILDNFRKPVVFPPIKELTISNPSRIVRVDFEAAMVGLAELQHALGVPFERVTFRMYFLATDMAERLRPWVGAVHCYKEVKRIRYTPM